MKISGMRFSYFGHQMNAKKKKVRQNEIQIKCNFIESFDVQNMKNAFH